MTLEELKSQLVETAQNRAEAIERRDNLKAELKRSAKTVDAFNGAIQMLQILIQKESESKPVDG